MSMNVFDFDTCEDLPLCAQVLLGSRLARRAVLAMMPAEPQSRQSVMLEALDAIDRIAARCDNVEAEAKPFRAVKKWTCKPGENLAVQAVEWMIDGAMAAVASLDFPVDTTVTSDLARCVNAIEEDPRVSALQLRTLLGSDLDQIRFACMEARINKYDGLGAQVFGRLTPVHALTLGAPRRSAEPVSERPRRPPIKPLVRNEANAKPAMPPIAKKPSKKFPMTEDDAR